MPIEKTLVITALLFLISTLASKMSKWLGVPALLVFIVIGMLAGSEGPGGIYLDNPEFVQSVGIIALAFILFSGGLDTRWDRIRPVLGRCMALSTAGVAITAGTVSLFAHHALGLTLVEGMLLGSIISSTDAAAVFGVLRSKQVRLHQRIESALELESGSNDPMAVLLTVNVIQYMLGQTEASWNLLPSLLLQLAIGMAFGIAVGRLMVWLMNHIHLEVDGLYSVLTISAVMLAYGAAAQFGGNGFLSVYVAGIVMGNRRFVQRIRLSRFHDGLAWLMQIVMFLILGLQVFPSGLPRVAVSGLALAAFLMFVARPLAIYLLLIGSQFDLRQRTLMAWVGLRGAVPIILGTYPMVSGLPKADTIFDLVFFVVLASVLVQGTTIPRIAALLGLECPECGEADRYTGPHIADNVTEVVIPGDSPIAGKQLLETPLPERAKVLLIRKRDGFHEIFGSTVLDAGDAVLLFGDAPTLRVAREVLEGKEQE